MPGASWRSIIPGEEPTDEKRKARKIALTKKETSKNEPQHSVSRDREMRRLLVLVANEPFTYRETLSAALRELRPDAEVLTVDPDSLDLELERRAPDLVACTNRAHPAGRRIPVWVDLYPNGESRVVVVAWGECSTLTEIGLNGLLSILDQISRRRGDSFAG